MNPGRIVDIDELVLRCRDDKARELLRESVQSYHAGAYRSSIVMTWNAVVIDIISKIRELSIAGDKAAAEEIQRFQATIETHDIAESLKLENNILETAQTRFDLFGKLEAIDFNRLREDRHRCAHPSMTSIETRYSPTAELARLHIRNAVELLLAHGPTQGKAALELLLADVASELFPESAEEARPILASGPLKRAKDQLVRNFIAALVSSFFTPERLHLQQVNRRAAALRVTLQLYPSTAHAILREKLREKTLRLTADDMFPLIQIAARVDESMKLCSEEMIAKTIAYVTNLSIDERPASQLIDILTVPELGKILIPRIEEIDSEKLSLLSRLWPREEFIGPLLSHYAKSRDFNTANKIGLALASLAPNFTADHVDRVLEIIAKNDQVAGSFGINAVARILVSTERTSRAHLVVAFDKAGYRPEHVDGILVAPIT